MRSAATPLPRLTTPRLAAVRVCLLSAGARRISGGHRYHQHLLAAAPDAGSRCRSCPARGRSARCRRRMSSSSTACTPGELRRRRDGAAIGRRPSPSCTSTRRVRRRRLGAHLRRRLDARHLPGLRPRGHARADRRRTCSSPSTDSTRTGIEVIEPGCDLAPADPSRRCGRGRRIGLLNVANWLPNKGIIELLDAVADASAVTTPPCISLGRTDVEPRYTTVIRRRMRTTRPRRSGRRPRAARRPGGRRACTRPPMRSPSRAESRRTAAQLPRRWPPACRSSGGAPPTCAASSTTRSRDCSSSTGQHRRAHGCDPPPRHRRRRTSTRWPKAPGAAAPDYLPGARRPADSSMSSPG